MDIKKLEKATIILKAIKNIDAEIIEIEKTAMLVANNDTESHFLLNVIDNEKPQEEENTEQENQGDPFSEFSGLLSFMAFRSSNKPEKENKNLHSLKCDLSVNATLQILGVLLYEKQTKRNKLINSLKKYGVNI